MHINRQGRDPEMGRGMILAFGLTLSVMVFEGGEMPILLLKW